MALLAALERTPAGAFAGRRVLDIGCGSGLYTVALLRAGAGHVTALDVNPACLATTLHNIEANGIDPSRVRLVHDDLATFALGERWDVIVSNPPHLPADHSYAATDGLSAALVGGRDGRALYDVVLARLDELLTPSGSLFLAHSSLVDIPRTIRELTSAGYAPATLEICEMDIPLRSLTDHRAHVLARLYPARAAGRALFTGLRYEVHTLVATHPSGGARR
jgi:release factor glutamine methyltransferase